MENLESLEEISSEITNLTNLLIQSMDSVFLNQVFLLQKMESIEGKLNQLELRMNKQEEKWNK